MAIPRLLIAGVRGGSGKTLVSLGLVAAWRKRGYSVAPFKKGPDYIDAAWLSRAAGRDCRNLDAFLMPRQTITRSFLDASAATDVAVIEGNRGLYDGLDARGTFSTAELAKLLRTPLVLVVDCTKTTRTAAAIVLGCQQLDREVPLRAVVLNRRAGARHEAVLREAIQQTCGLPVLGSIPRLRWQLFPERHLGLIPPEEHGEQERSIERVAEIAEEYLDLEALWRLAQAAPAAPQPSSAHPLPPVSRPAGVRVAVLRDAAFQFYYPDNLEALVREGAELVAVSPIDDPQLPDVDALYIGGGFPETLAAALAENGPFRESVRRAVEADMPVYAECGGAVFLGEKLVIDQHEYPMAGVFPATFLFHEKMRGHGYVELETVGENPFYCVGQTIRGHEFHYTCIEPSATQRLRFAFRVRRGFGFDGRRDGLVHRNTLACYTHVHALGVTDWAGAIVQAAVRFRSAR